MGRPRKQILSNETYEICMRTQFGLPFVTAFYMNLIIEGIMARVQRDMKVIINHIIWMTNHAHIIIEARDIDQCKAFYGEVQKQLTEAIKRLLGKKHLSLWRSNETSVVHLGDAEGIMNRIAYLYSNPSRANLVETIDHYPGISSWKGFLEAPSTLDAEISKTCPWIQAPMIPRLPCASVNPTQDLRLVERMRGMAVRSHKLVVHPNAWMKKFGITAPEEIAEKNRSIRAMVEENEASQRRLRQREGRRVMGANRLRRQPLTLTYTPKKETQRIFVYAADKSLRIEMIKAYRAFCDKCRECYERWKRGDYAVKWPPGAYRPPQPSNANWFEA